MHPPLCTHANRGAASPFRNHVLSEHVGSTDVGWVTRPHALPPIGACVHTRRHKYIVCVRVFFSLFKALYCFMKHIFVVWSIAARTSDDAGRMPHTINGHSM